MKNLNCFWILALLYFSSCGPDPVQDLTQKVLIYEKSNWDGTNKGNIAVYYEEANKLESFKWHEGQQEATIVRAWMDSLSHTVRRFEAYRVDQSGNEKSTAVLQALPDGALEIRLGDFQQEFRDTPKQWHSYDFDFASLGYAYRWLREEARPISFHILDPDLKKSTPALRDFGAVEMVFQQEEVKGDRTVLAYRIDGVGLEHRGGTIRFDKDQGYLDSFEIEKPDEPGYDSGKLVLKSVIHMDKPEWIDFKLRQLNPVQ